MQDNFDSAIAVVGMAIRAPGARDDAELWRNLSAGVESITFFSDEELIEQGVPAELVRDPSYVKARGVLDDHEMFDSEFFGIPAREADLMDPQHRVFLQATYHALEDAGRINGEIGPVDLYAGAGFNSYMHQVVVPQQHVLSPVDMYQMSLGNEHSYIATRTSYRLNLSGASMHIDTACSSGLTAVHMACQSLLSGQSRMAVAGAVAIPVPQRAGYLYQPDGIQSPDGHCRSFDAEAGGFVEGSGVGVVVLRLLEDALADGDRIRAVIRSSAINNDGSAKIGFTAPSVEAQSAVVRDAMALAEVGPEDIDYVEAHGTATRLGDPVEIAALAKAFRGRPADAAPVYLGTAKSNMGHLGAASGMLGLVKVVLSLENEQLPPSLHFTKPNPEMEIERTPFEVNDRLRPWPRGERARRAGVTSLGMGGTNVHLVLEEAPRVERPGEPAAEVPRLIPLSARTPEALARLEGELAAALTGIGAGELADLGHTLATGRQNFDERGAVVVHPRGGGAEALTTHGPGYVRGSASGPKPSVVFLFPGQGAQYAGMTRELYGCEPVFREAMDACAALVAHAGGPDLLEGLYGEAASAEAADLADTRWTQLALFAVGYALARTWESWGVRPAVMAGHSIGEYVAACLAGVFSLEDAVRLVTRRAELMAELPSGAMLAVQAPAGDVRGLLDAEVSVAVETSPGHCVLSGPHEAIERQDKALRDAGLRTTVLRVSHAFHSAMMEPAQRAFAAEVAACDLSAPIVPFLSNVTGTWITTAEAMDPEYWARHLRQTVKLADNLAEVLADPARVLVEVGPGSSLITAARRVEATSSERVMVASLPGAREDSDDLEHLLRAAGRLWTAGATLDWDHLYDGEKRRRTGAPLYPFERRAHWLRTDASAQRPAATAPAAPTVEATATVPAVASAPSREAVEQAVREAVADVVGADPDRVAPDEPLIQQGLDSVLLLQLTHRVKTRFGVLVSLSQLLDEINTPVALAAYVAGRTEVFQAPEPVPAPVQAGDDSELSAQLAALSAQLKAIEARFSGTAAPTARAASATIPPVPALAAAPASVAPAADAGASQPAASGSQVWGSADTTGALTASWSEEQHRNLERFKQRYLERTARSREYAERTRGTHADPRTAARFQMAWKDLQYPIVAERTEGARMWDLDGNEYVDLAMGFGVHMFGHRPPFVMRALEEQMARGIHLGPQSDLAGEVADRLCELTGNERVAFCNTGTEAVMTAMRIARAVTGRDKIVLFTNAYHGTFDGTLGRPRADSAEAFSGPPGTPRGMVSDVLILEYGSDRALEIIAERAHELAAVMVEPIQSRVPGRQLPEFLRKLRQVTTENELALIFDEVITGFRLAPGGGQEWAGVRADLVVYGKVLGGGLPIGVIAGKGSYLDAIDGGAWNYGDDSYPMVPQTFFAGTFSKNPLTMAATRAVLQQLAEEGPELQQRLTERTSALVAELNSFCEAEDLPMRLSSCASLFAFHFDPRAGVDDLFFHRLVTKGVYVWEGRSCFLSTAHGPEDIARITSAVRESLLELRAEGFLPAAARPAPQVVPLTEGQQHLWIADQCGEDSTAFNEFLALHLRGPLDRAALDASFQALVDRHESLRTTFSAQGDVCHVAATARADVSWEEAAPGDGLAEVTARHTGYGRHPLDLSEGPLLRVHVTRLGGEEHVLSLVIHHLISDAWSMGVILRELDALYRQGGDPSGLPVAASFTQYARETAAWRDSEDGASARRYWAERFPEGVTALELPSDFPRDDRRARAGARNRRTVDAELWQDMVRAGARAGATPFMMALAAYQTVLVAHSGQRTVHLGIHGAGQVDATADNLVGYCINVLPVGGEIDPKESLESFLKRVREDVAGAFEHRRVPFGGLHATAGAPVLTTAFNLERGGGDGVRLGELEVGLLPAEVPSARWELNLNCIEVGEQILLELTYDTGLFRSESADALLASYERVLKAMGRGESERVAELLAAARPPAAEAESAADGPISGRRRRVPAAEAPAPVTAQPLVRTLPLVVEAPQGVTDLAGWAAERREELRRQVVEHGGVLFRGFDTGIEGFEELVRAVSGEPLTYQERTSPRHAVHNRVYTSTDFPPHERIYPHNEQSYNLSWPLRIFFHCATAPAEGGQTPIADCRRIYARLRPATRDAFAEHGYAYVRHFREGLGLSWRESFQTEDRAEVERYCAENAIEFEWHGDDLTTRQIRPAIARHPVSGELTWFNHATFFHVSTLPAAIRDSLLSSLSEGELPNNTYFGDGRPIPPQVLEELRAAYEAETVQFDWQRGDVLMLDNMLTAHARAPFTPPRKIVVAMSEPCSLNSPAGGRAHV
ncbi:aminotransferase class III-fold pyridoxal phosphate-dependent enzyme [Streptomyces noursei]|uniref:aminotransferase class III-fold pyridoxal phosphate-dependent enzyme n=1 Tax=Streptomyces noursei TaxID=1971 RepID=UPI0030F15729